MRLASPLLLPLIGAALLAACSDTLSPAPARVLRLTPGNVLPRTLVAEPARIPVQVHVECGDHGSLAVDIEAADGVMFVTARGRATDFRGGCVDDLDTILHDTVTVSPLIMRDTTIVRFRQPDGADSIRVVLRAPLTAAP